jgi:hypothetical protein
MDKAGLITKMADAVDNIAQGRIGLELDGEEHNGRVSLNKGVDNAAALYTEAMRSGNLELMLWAEYTYTSAEKERGKPDETGADASAASALQNFDDAFLALQVVENSELYNAVDMALPHHGKTWRHGGFPRDAFHVACDGHITRIRNGLSRYGVNSRERTLADLRIKVFITAQQLYVEKQQKALANPRGEKE